MYSLCRWVNTHTPRHSYIYFIYLNMKYTFYRCFTSLLSVHRSPKVSEPKRHLQWIQASWVRRGIMRSLSSVGAPASEPPTYPPALDSCPSWEQQIRGTALLRGNGTKSCTQHSLTPSSIHMHHTQNTLGLLLSIGL